MATFFRSRAFKARNRRLVPSKAGTVDTVTVDSANLSLTGQTITTVDVCPITQANLSLTGSNILELDTIGITSADLPLSGSTITTVDVTPITAANLDLAGQNITELDTIGIVSADLPLSGSTITVFDSELVPITAANLDLTGQSILELDTIGITQANLSLTGQAITTIDVTPIAAANLDLAGQNITEIDTVGVVSADLPLQGQSIDVTDVGSDTVTIDSVALLLAGSEIRVVDPSNQKDGDADYWNLPWFRAEEGESFSEKLRKQTEIPTDEDPVFAEPVAPKPKRKGKKAAGPLLADEFEAPPVTKQEPKVIPPRRQDAYLLKAMELQRKAALEFEQDEEEALIALGMY